MRYTTRLIAACLCSVVLAACGSSPTTPDEPVPLPNQELDGRPKTTGVVIDDANEGQKIDPDSVAGRAPAERVIFFDYDQDEIRTEYLDVVARHGRFLAENPEGRVRLEGHTDERGTREYNIALGELRSQSVGELLELQGVGRNQIRTVTYGEELPVDEGHDNEAWAKNRRVNIIYETGVPN